MVSIMSHPSPPLSLAHPSPPPPPPLPGSAVRSISGHKAAVSSLDFHRYGDILASGSMDTNVKVEYHTRNAHRGGGGEGGGDPGISPWN